MISINIRNFPQKNIFLLLIILLNLVFFQFPHTMVAFIFSSLYVYLLRGAEYALKTPLKFLPFTIFIWLLSSAINIYIGHLNLNAAGILSNFLYYLNCFVCVMSVVFWCDSFGDKIDEIFYIFREKAPNTTLILSLTLRMMPKFSDDFRFISISQRCSGNVCEGSGWIKKIKYFLDIFFIFLCFEFKNLNESALSLESREYSPGILPRIAGEKKKFASIPEVAFKIAMFTLAVVIILLNGCGFEGLSVLLYAVFCAVPLIICLLEVLMCRSFL